MTIGLSLSGGALRGIFHLGVIEALEEGGIGIDVLAGTSSGSIVATLYSDGKSPQDILKIASSSSLLKMMRLKPWAGGLLTHDYLKSLLNDHLTTKRLEDLPKRVKVTATNLRTGTLTVFEEGEIVPIVMASSAIPVMFNPVQIGDEYYVDGGLLMNLPVTPIREECDVVIGVNLVPEVELPRDKLSNFLKVVERTFDLAVLNNIRPESEKLDILVSMERLQEVGRMSFAGMSKVFDMGYEATQAVLPEIKELLEHHASLGEGT